VENPQHWQSVYQTKAPSEVSWYQPEALTSLRLIRSVAPHLDTPIIDAGGGASALVDGLLNVGYRDLTVLDVAPAGLSAARQRLAQRGDRIRWIVANVLDFRFPEASYGLWHDRAVFHFLTAPADRATYVEQVRKSVRSGGHVIVSSFGLAGPPKCSGLDVVRYDAKGLAGAFGQGFTLLERLDEEHRTPAGKIQSFIYCSFLKE
jgi:hypothetical protein